LNKNKKEKFIELINSKYDKNIYNEIVSSCEKSINSNNWNSWSVSFRSMGNSNGSWTKSAHPLIITFVDKVQPQDLGNGQKRYSRTYYTFTEEKCIKAACLHLLIKQTFAVGFIDGFATRTNRTDIFNKRINLRSNFFSEETMKKLKTSGSITREEYIAGFATGRKIKWDIKDPKIIDKKPAIKQLKGSFDRALKAGLEPEDIKRVVDEFLTEKILGM